MIEQTGGVNTVLAAAPTSSSQQQAVGQLKKLISLVEVIAVAATVSAAANIYVLLRRAYSRNVDKKVRELSNSRANLADARV